MTRTDAFQFAARKVIERQRPYIDMMNVKSIDIHITINEAGKANVIVTPRHEETIIGCHEGVQRIEKYSFNTT